MEIVKSKRGVKKGTVRGAYKEIKKNKRFLSYRVDLETESKYKQIFKSYKNKYGLKSTQAIFKIFDTIKEIENL